MAPKHVVEAVHGFTPDLPPRPGWGRGEDHEFLLKVAASWDFVMIRRPLVRYRYNRPSLSASAQGHDYLLGDIGILRHHLVAAADSYKPVIAAFSG